MRIRFFVFIIFSVVLCYSQNTNILSQDTGHIKISFICGNAEPVANTEGIMFIDGSRGRKFKTDGDGHLITKLKAGKRNIRTKTEKYCVYEMQDILISANKTTYLHWKLSLKTAPKDNCKIIEKYKVDLIDKNTGHPLGIDREDYIKRERRMNIELQKTLWERLSEEERKKMVEEYYKVKIK